MNIPAEVPSRCLKLIKEHFAALNRGDATQARRQLFHPPATPRLPLEVYVAKMLRGVPFVLERAEVVDTDPPKPSEYGNIGKVRVAITVSSPSFGVHEEVVPIWWFAQSGELLIAARFSNWPAAAKA